MTVQYYEILIYESEKMRMATVSHFPVDSKNIIDFRIMGSKMEKILTRKKLDDI